MFLLDRVLMVIDVFVFVVDFVRDISTKSLSNQLLSNIDHLQFHREMLSIQVRYLVSM